MKHLKQRLQREYEQQLDDEKGAFAMENQKMMQNMDGGNFNGMDFLY